jgi:magnesium transporter
MELRVGPEHLDEPVSAFVRRDVTRFRQDQTVGDARRSLRDTPIAERIVYFYVVDAEDRLVGVVPMRRFIAADSARSIRDLMLTDVVRIPNTATVLEASEEFLEHRLLALPVVDAAGKLEGAVDITMFTDEVSAAAHKHERDHAFQLIGVHVALGRKVAPWVSFRDRFPWLLCNMASGILCAFLAARYELLISEVTLLALFITVVLALGESVSMQSMTITLEQLSMQRASWRGTAKTLGRELATALMLGLASAALVGLVAWVWRGAALAAVSVGLSIAAAIITACLLGILVPTAIHAARANPRVAAGPIVLAATDLATLGFYFGLATWILR